jgi:hypothetical protein
MMSSGMPSSVIWTARYESSECCSNADYEIIAVRRLGCHFYEVIKNHQMTLKTMVRGNFNATTTNSKLAA